VVFERIGTGASSGRVSLPTAGWASGTYVVTVAGEAFGERSWQVVKGR